METLQMSLGAADFAASVSPCRTFDEVLAEATATRPTSSSSASTSRAPVTATT